MWSSLNTNALREFNEFQFSIQGNKGNCWDLNFLFSIEFLEGNFIDTENIVYFIKERENNKK